jgi:S-adenosylmethionine:tRNA ribosyltransferase-isomerase
MLTKSDLRFNHPNTLIATEPRFPKRVAWVSEKSIPEEITIAELLARIPAGDVLVFNETQVLRRRIFVGELEILFLLQESASENIWQVMMPTRGLEIGAKIALPEGVELTLLEKGRPQRLQASQFLAPEYFIKHGDLPLPPYIQKARGARKPTEQDSAWYQTEWAKEPGSLAAPTASLHFSKKDFEALRERGVCVAPLVLHVSLGTFLPIISENLNEHVMHEEIVQIPESTWAQVQNAKKEGRKIWALGTTVARSLEAQARGEFALKDESFSGATKIFLKPGVQWQVVDRLLTNFHQPESTLLALVASFIGSAAWRDVYQWAIDRQFQLFSYGDLSVWQRPQI